MRIGSAKLGGDFLTFKFNVAAQPVLYEAAGRIATLGAEVENGAPQAPLMFLAALAGSLVFSGQGMDSVGRHYLYKSET